MEKYKILENENYVFDMGPEKYLEYFVYPGQFQYRAKTGTMSGLISDPLDIEIKAGETHYLRFDFIRGVFTSRSRFTRVYSEQALEEIKYCEEQVERYINH